MTNIIKATVPLYPYELFEYLYYEKECDLDFNINGMDYIKFDSFKDDSLQNILKILYDNIEQKSIEINNYEDLSLIYQYDRILGLEYSQYFPHDESMKKHKKEFFRVNSNINRKLSDYDLNKDFSTVFINEEPKYITIDCSELLNNETFMKDALEKPKFRKIIENPIITQCIKEGKTYNGPTKIEDLSYLCRYASLYDIESIKNWDFHNVKYFTGMFEKNEKITNLDFLSDWDISSGIDFSNMFKDCINLTDIKGIEKWNLKNKTGINIENIFENCPI